MNKLTKHTWINFISLLIGVLLVYAIGEYLMDPANNRSHTGDNALGDLSLLMGSFFLAITFGFLVLIAWSIRVIWIIKKYWKRSYLIGINMVMLILPWSPFIILGSIKFYVDTINKIKRNEIIFSNDKYNTIKFDKGYGLFSYINNKDSIFIAIKEFRDDDPESKYYILNDDHLTEIDKSRIQHLLTHQETRDGIGFDIFKENINEPTHPFVLNILDNFHDPNNGISFPKAYLFDTINHLNIDSLEGFEEIKLSSEEDSLTTFSIDEKGTLYFPFWNLRGGPNYEYFLYIAVKKKNERVQIRQVNLDLLPLEDRQNLTEEIQDFIVFGNYFYIISNDKIYYHKQKA